MKEFTDDKKLLESEGRRKAVKRIIGGVTAVAAYNLLPAQWGAPVMESVFMPAHAATSGTSLNDPCSVTRRSGNTTTNSVSVRVTGFVTPPTANVAITITATAVGGTGAGETVSTTTQDDGTYAANISLSGGPGITRVNVTTTAEGVTGSAECHANIPAPSESSCCGASGTVILNSLARIEGLLYVTCDGITMATPGSIGPVIISLINVDIRQPVTILMTAGNVISDLDNITFTSIAPGQYGGTVTTCGPFEVTISPSPSMPM